MRLGISGTDAGWAVFAALLGMASFPPFGAWPLMPVSLVLLLHTLGKKTSSEARGIGLCYGLFFGLGTMYWFFNLFGVYALALVFLMAAYFGFLASLVGMTSSWPLVGRCLAIGCFAVAIEWVRGDAWYLRFPWYTPPHALAQAPPLIAGCRWLGVYGLSFLIWSLAALSALGRPVYALAFLMLPAAYLCLPHFALPDRTAVLVQVEDSFKVPTVLAEMPQRFVDLVVLPEYAYPDGIEAALHSPRGPVAVARSSNCPVVFGTVEGQYGAPKFQNVAAVLDERGKLVGTFPKQHPVPLMADGLPGDRCPVFPVGDGILGIGLCYDFDGPAVAGSLTSAGATVLLAPTGDLMSWGRVQHLNHELLVRLRAVENDRWVLRPTTSGQSEAIDPHGFPSAESLGIGETGTVEVQFGYRTSNVLGSRAHWLGPLSAAVTALLVSAQAVVWIRRKSLDKRNLQPGNEKADSGT
ncbi:apolipoprotein N-acyltransferase [soil metagenome]